MNKQFYNENMNAMRVKIVLSAVLVMVVGVFQGYSQHHPTSDDKVLIMQEIENLSEANGRKPFKEWWKEARKVENFSLLLGYSSYGAPWGSDALHGGTLGVSNNHFMMSFDFGFGSMIDETAYNNSEAYDYLKAKSTQSFFVLYSSMTVIITKSRAPIDLDSSLAAMYWV